MTTTEIEILKKELEDLNKRVAALGGAWFEDLDQAIINFGGEVKGVESAIRMLRSEMNELDTDTNYFFETLKKITKELAGQRNYNKDILKGYTQLSSVANQLKYDQDGIHNLSEKELEKLRKRIQIQKTDLTDFLSKNEDALNISINKQDRINELIKEIFDIERKKGRLSKEEEERLSRLSKMLANEEKNQKSIKDYNAELKDLLNDQITGVEVLEKLALKRLATEKTINEKMGLTGAIVDGLVGVLGKLGINPSYFEDVKDEMRNAAEHSKNAWEVLGQGIKGVFNGLGKALKDPLTIILAIGAGLLAASDLVIKLQRGLGIAYKNAYLLQLEMSAFSLATDDTFITAERLNASMIELTKTLGFVPAYGIKSLETFTNLTEKLGMSSQEASNLVTYARLQGESTETTMENMGKVVTSMNKAKGTAILLRQIMSDVANTSKAITVSLGMNPILITRAATAARQLGLNLAQVDKIAESLLNFESSIDNELQAELLTGKEINLERARALALANDLEGLTKEIGKNQAVINTFSKGNRVAQEAVARSLGMSREELANMIYQQEALKIGAEGVRRKYGEQAYQALLAQTASEKFANILNKIKSIFVSIATLFEPIIDGIAWLLDHTILWEAVLIGIGVVQFPRIIAGIATMGKSLMSIFSLSTIKNWGNQLLSFLGKAKAISSTIPIPGTSPTPGGGPSPAVPPSSSTGGGLSNFIKNINPAALIKGAAAIAILSGALFISAKAFQEFAEVEWENIAKGGVALAGLAGVAALLGSLNGPILAGSIAIALLGASLIPLGFALKLAAPGIESFGKATKLAFEGLSGVITAAADGIAKIVSEVGKLDVTKMLLMGTALMSIAAGLGAVSIAGLAALPALGALSAIEAIASTFDIGVKNESNDSNTDKNGITTKVQVDLSPMITAINEVKKSVDDLARKQIVVNLDGKKVGSGAYAASTKIA